MKKSSTSIALDATSVGLKLKILTAASFPNDPQSVFRSEPYTYMSNLANYQSKRHAWSRHASLLTRRTEDSSKLQKLLLTTVVKIQFLFYPAATNYVQVKNV